jgi:FAD/FMN-containing dehydrogenase
MPCMLIDLGVIGGYVNFNLEAEETGKQFGSNYDRLREIKKKYDPENFFRNNHNILPSV